MVNQIKLSLEQSEYRALINLAMKELRSPVAQAQHIIRRELKRRGLLKEDKDRPRRNTLREVQSDDSRD